MDGVHEPEDVLQRFDEDEEESFAEGFVVLAASLRLNVRDLETDEVADERAEQRDEPGDETGQPKPVRFDFEHLGVGEPGHVLAQIVEMRGQIVDDGQDSYDQVPFVFAKAVGQGGVEHGHVIKEAQNDPGARYLRGQSGPGGPFGRLVVIEARHHFGRVADERERLVMTSVSFEELLEKVHFGRPVRLIDKESADLIDSWLIIPSNSDAMMEPLDLWS